MLTALTLVGRIVTITRLSPGTVVIAVVDLVLGVHPVGEGAVIVGDDDGVAPISRAR
jgi:hypothetical protein